MKRFADTCAAALVFAAAPLLHAQDYPKGPISLIIPLAPGDASALAKQIRADVYIDATIDKTATGFKLKAGFGFPLGRPRCDARITFAPWSRE